MTPIRKLLLMKMFAGGVPISEYTATGNPLTFNTNVVKPLKSLVLPWTPVQSGTGDPSPENVRSISGVSALNVWQNDSVNQWDEQWEVGAYNAAGNPVTGSNQIRSKYLIPVEPETEYYFYIGMNVNCRIYFCAENGSVLSYQAQGKGTFTTPVNCKWLKFHTGSGYGETYGSNISINKPSTDTDYHAHAPSVSVTFPALGKNLFDKAHMTRVDYKQYNDQGVETSASTAGYFDEYVPVEPSTGYALSGIGRSAIYYYTADKGWISRGDASDGTKTFTTPQNCYFIRIQYRVSDLNVDTIQLEQGSATSYEPYTNTVYGGSLDVVSGVLTVEYCLVSFTKSQFGDKQTGSVGIEYRMSDYLVYPLPDTASGTNWNLAREQQMFNYGKIANPWGESEYGNNIGVIVTQSFGTTMRISESIYQAMSDTDTADISYKLATPQTYQLTPQQISALLGDNVIWTDTNGSNTAVYLKKG